jgi:hypothetical protein
LGGRRSAGKARLATDSRDAVDGAGVRERGVDVVGVLERLGTGGGGRGDVRPGPVCKVGEFPATKEIDAFRPFFHRDLMLLTGFSETLVRLFTPSSDESSEKRLDGGLDSASTRLARLFL